MKNIIPCILLLFTFFISNLAYCQYSDKDVQLKEINKSIIKLCNPIDNEGAKKELLKYDKNLVIESLKIAIKDTKKDEARYDASYFLLEEMKPPGLIDFCTKLLKDSSSLVRSSAYAYLGNCKDAKAIPILLEALNSEKDDDEYLDIIQQLGNYKDEVVSKRLISIFESIKSDTKQNTHILKYIIYILGENKVSSATDLLINTFENEPKLRGYSVLALGKIRDKKVIPIIQKIQNKENSVEISYVLGLFNVEYGKNRDYIIKMLFKTHDFWKEKQIDEAFSNYDNCLSALKEFSLSRIDNKALKSLMEYAPSTDAHFSEMMIEVLTEISFINPKLFLETLIQVDDKTKNLIMDFTNPSWLGDDRKKEEFFIKWTKYIDTTKGDLKELGNKFINYVRMHSY